MNTDTARGQLLEKIEREDGLEILEQIKNRKTPAPGGAVDPTGALVSSSGAFAGVVQLISEFKVKHLRK